MKNVIGNLATSLAAGLILGVTSVTTAFAESDTVKIKYGFLPFPVVPVFAAKAHGAFEANGIELEMTKFTSGPAEFQALQAGSIDIAHGALAAFYMASSRGLDAKWVYAFGDNSNQGGLVVTGDSELSGAADFAKLKGKKVAAPSGSILHLLHLHALNQAELTVEDMEFVSLAPPQGVAALRGGDVEAAWLWDPFVSAATKNGAKVAFTNTDIGGGDIFGLTVNADWLASDGSEEVLTRLFKAFDEGVAAYAKDPGPTLDEVEATLGLDRDLAERLMNGVTWFSNADQLAEGTPVNMSSLDDSTTGVMEQVKKIEDMALWGGLIDQKGAGQEFFAPAAAKAAVGN